MVGLVEGRTPSYISAQSADVILSDVRPFKLKTEALHAINVFLDEFLYNILNVAGSLSTDKLRGSLLSLLPTSLGKEALLEAEVELRAYWNRTNAEEGPRLEAGDDSKTFHLQWSFELLRLKCEAYSTLNERDEDPSVEERLRERFIQSVAIPPSGALLAPAALYLTAILEAMCEHILTNVGRVAARDSSRVNATVNDLFTALCEDDSIYGLFRSMRVYEQIELLSKGPVKSRRSKSFSRSELSTTLSSRTGSPHQDLLSGKESIIIPRSRLSSEVSSTTPNMPGVTTTPSRPSIEKARSIKLFKSSLESESQNGSISHKKSESFISEKTLDDGQKSLTEESMLQQEFDDLMRSSSTMKVSLTPDRLKTMEVYKQEKDMRSTKRPVPPSFKSDSDSISLKRPSLRNVDSIIEDEEELAFPQPPATTPARIRHESSATTPSVSLFTASANRIRSMSSTSLVGRKPPPPIPSAFSQTPRAMTRPNNFAEPSGFPTRTRKRQVNRESLDLDDVMAGSDDEDTPTADPPPRSAASPRGMSAATRELVDFLAQGPPDEMVGHGGGLNDFLNSGPPRHNPSRHNPSSASLDAKPKGDRLRRMISKISIGNGEKSKNGPPTPSKTPVTKQQPPLPIPVAPIPPRLPRLTSQNSLNGLSSLANRPVPPRPPRPPSPPPSDQEISPPPSPVKTATPTVPYSPAPSSIRSSNRPPSPALVPPRKDSRDRTPSRQTTVNGSAHTSLNGSLNGSANGHANGKIKQPKDTIASKPAIDELLHHTINDADDSLPSPPQNRKAQTGAITIPSSDPDVGLSPSEVGHLHRLMSTATSADECRLILDMFIAKHKVALEPQNAADALPSSSTRGADAGEIASAEDAALEQSLVAFFLGEEGRLEGVPRAAPNGLPTTASINIRGADDKPSTPIADSPSYKDNNNNTLVGEMQA